MDFEFLYATAADSIEVGDVIAYNGDTVEVETVTDHATLIVVTGVSQVTGDTEYYEIDPHKMVDILGN